MSAIDGESPPPMNPESVPQKDGYVSRIFGSASSADLRAASLVSSEASEVATSPGYPEYCRRG
jgi:hypothetical protein